MTLYFQIFTTFLRLGLSGFGGPIAHLGLFHREFVRERAWLSEAAFADLISLAQMLPGPSSSQVGFAIGRMRGGLLGAIAAWLGFTLPSAVVMGLFAIWLSRQSGLEDAGWLHGIKLVTVAVVAQALWAMARSLWRDVPHLLIGLASTALLLTWPKGSTQIIALSLGGVLGFLVARKGGKGEHHATNKPMTRFDLRPASIGFIGCALLLAVGSLDRGASSAGALAALAAKFFRIGASVFGGGHVVLPLMQSELVQTGVVSSAQLEAVYGAAQAMPGPLFNVASSVGALAMPSVPVWGAVVATFAIFLPGLVLINAFLPIWGALRQRPHVAHFINGVNAASVGLLLSAFTKYVLPSSVHSPVDAMVALLCAWTLMRGMAQVWLLMPIAGIVGAFILK